MRRRRQLFDRRSLLGSAAVHGVAVVVIVLLSTVQPEPLDFVAYEIELVSPAPPAQAPEPVTAAEELVVETPEPAQPEATPEPPAPTPERTPPATEAPRPEPEERPTPPEPTPPKPETPPPAEPETRRPAAEPDAPAETRETGENINVRMEGLRRDYPEYYNNIIRQMSRCFQWRGADGLRAVIQFVILRDGSVENPRIVQTSNNAMFDIEAIGAAECAGNGRFGPLPDDLPLDRFPIRFEFNPSGRDVVQVMPSRPATS